jgi:hypothetical protein
MQFIAREHFGRKIAHWLLFAGVQQNALGGAPNRSV